MYFSQKIDSLTMLVMEPYIDLTGLGKVGPNRLMGEVTTIHFASSWMVPSRHELIGPPI